jgi:dsRNA-specific ribonuclease
MLTSENHTLSLKRTRSLTPAGDMEQPVPALPKISGDTILQVFTHPSLRHKTDARPEEYEDNARLTVLGEAALQMAVTSYLVRRQPMLSSDEMSVRSGYSNCSF